MASYEPAASHGQLAPKERSAPSEPAPVPGGHAPSTPEAGELLSKPRSGPVRAKLPLIAVVGATGTGKSDLAISLAQTLDGEIINADALQFYRGMDIGTAKQPVNERGGIPHHLLDTLDLVEEASVEVYQRQAREIIADIRQRGKAAILVGGSGLYVRAVLDRLEFPGTDPAVRAAFEARAQSEGIEPLRSQLAAVDPISAARINDARRIIRALEVYTITGRPFSAFMPERDYLQDTVQIGLSLPRPELNERLAARVHRMRDSGLLAEVESLAGQGLREGRTSSRAIGYQQFLKVLDGHWELPEAVEDTIVATRKFAKRQVTWFRGDPRVNWLNADAAELAEQAAAVVLNHE